MLKNKTLRSGYLALTGAIMAGLLTALAVGWGLQLGQSAGILPGGNTDYPQFAVAATATRSALVGDPGLIAGIVDNVGSAVVKIETKTIDKRTQRLLNDPYFRQFFGNNLPTPRTRQGLGSGFIISRDGYVVTNEHVVSGADEILVKLLDYEEPFTAKVVGSDHELDLAVLKLESAEPLPFLAMGDSEQARVGDWMIAIGNPYGLDHTVTVGVLSAKGRPVDVQDRSYRNLLQTDASINPGNSGGPLLNLRGQVVGVNTAVNAQAQGIGFAIPSNTVKEAVANLIH